MFCSTLCYTHVIPTPETLICILVVLQVGGMWVCYAYWATNISNFVVSDIWKWLNRGLMSSLCMDVNIWTLEHMVKS